jgi:ABC-2 type transport system permease protein
VVSVWAITKVELLRFLRDRSNLFFVFVFPLLLVALIGAQFGGGPEARLGVTGATDDPAAEELVGAIERGGEVGVVRHGTEEDLADAVARGTLAGGIVLPADLGASLDTADAVSITYLGRPDATSLALRSVVDAAVAEVAAASNAAAVAASITGTSAAELVDVAAAVRGEVQALEVNSTTLGTDELAEEFAGLEQFDIGASSQLFLFTFLTSLAGGAALIQTRRYGVARRMAASPISMGEIVAGHAGGRLVVALVQAGYIVVASWLIFGVNWGDPLASTLVIVLFAAVAAAAGMLVGATFHNDSQASGAGVGLGLGLAALGGSMLPLELFPEGVRTLAHVTPHAWANEAMAELVRRDGNVADVVLEIGVLAAMAVLLFSLAAWQLRRALLR